MYSENTELSVISHMSLKVKMIPEISKQMKYGLLLSEMTLNAKHKQ